MCCGLCSTLRAQPVLPLTLFFSVCISVSVSAFCPDVSVFLFLPSPQLSLGVSLLFS